MQPWYKVGAAALRLAETDTKEALSLARTIADPYPRAHILAKIGFYAKGDQARNILEEARAASWSTPDPFQVVDSSVGRMAALIDRGDTAAATKELALLLACADKIAHPVSRLEALSALLPVVLEVERFRRNVLDAQIRAAREARSWRSGARLRDAAIMLAGSGFPEEAALVLAAMPQGRYRRQAERGAQ